MTPPRRRPARYVTLPGGARLTFRGYLPSRTCPACEQRFLDAAYFVKAVVARSRRRVLLFGDWCLQCDPPRRDLPRELNGVRPSSTYKDDSGALAGWRQRTRAGCFGPELKLETMGLRQTADGVYRPQPKLYRGRGEQPPTLRRYAPVRDSRRTYSRTDLATMVRRQRGRCAACGLRFTADDPAEGDHDLPFADGGATDLANGRALHRSCNNKKRRRTLHEYQRDCALF